MASHPGNHVRIIHVISTLILVLLVPVLSYGQESERYIRCGTGELGSITGVVVCPAGDEIIGKIMLFEDGEYYDETSDIGPDGDFIFVEVRDGTYDAVFLEQYEIPVAELTGIEVVLGETTEVTITVPFTIDGMSCNDRLCLGIQGYFDFVFGLVEDSVASPGWLSEQGEDWVSLLYGECKAQENDYLIQGLDESDQETIQELRLALEDFEVGYYHAHMFLGSGAGHFSSRALAYREEFIDLAVRRIELPARVTDDEVDNALDILDRLESVVYAVDESYWDEETEQLYYEMLDEFDAAAVHLRGITLDLPDDMVVIVADYVSEYLPPDM